MIYNTRLSDPRNTRERINDVSDQKETIYQNATKVSVMQLPRGTFREIKKGETIEGILMELERSRFSGVCSLSSGEGTGTLVYKSGKCILVKYHGKSGDSGWEELLKNRTGEVDAALSTLDDAQIQLSLEFNKACRLIKGGKTQEDVKRAVQPAHEPVKKPSPPVQTPAPSAMKTPLKPAAASSLFHRPAPPAVPQPATPEPKQPKPVSGIARPAMPAPPSVPRPASSQAETKSTASEGESADSIGQGSSFEKDIDTFDTMDLDNVTDKIRNDCKTMIKQLHLEHLMER
jgi:hypothetical protein